MSEPQLSPDDPSDFDEWIESCPFPLTYPQEELLRDWHDTYVGDMKAGV